MIEPMKKVTFLVTNKEYEGFIATLRSLGAVHLRQLRQGASSPGLAEAMELERRYRAASLYAEVEAKTYGKSVAMAPSAECDGLAPGALLARVEELRSRELSLQHAIDAADKDIARLEPWGEFSQDDVERLARACGRRVCFFRCGSKSFRKEWVDEYFATPVNELGKSVYFVTLSPSEPDIQAERVQLPAGTLRERRDERARLGAELEALRGELLRVHARCQGALDEGLVAARNAISLGKARLSDEAVAGDALRLMVGWVRADKAGDLAAALDRDGIYYEMEDPAFDDDVPVQITNGPYTRLFEPILRMYSLPNYRDIDPSVFFAPFFMLFFGLCLGDGGYGLLVFLGGLALALKGKGQTRSYGRLGVWLGLMTVVCGLLTGTVFGVDLSRQDWAVLAPVKPYFLNDNGVGLLFGYSPMMVISVFIGLAQVLLGMVLKGCKAWKNYGPGYAVGTFSWVTALVCALAAFGLPQCGVPLPSWLSAALVGLTGVSCLGIFFYNNPSAYKNPLTGPLLNIGGGVWATYGMATGLLGDLLSYIRLFALGLTGGVLGGVFNSLAYDMTDGMPWLVRWLPMTLVLLAGHGITFALSMISAFVHPMRLTFVEFFKNADYQGGGKEYSPFRVIRTKE